MHKLNTNIIPNCIESMPKLCAIGKNIGVNINIAGVASINVPTTNNNIFIINNITIGLSDKPNIKSVIYVGTFVKANIQDIIDDAPIKNTIIAVMFTASNNILGRSFNFIDLYKNIDNNKEYTTAIAAPSVAVNIPPVIPPIIITINDKLGIASKTTFKA